MNRILPTLVLLSGVALLAPEPRAAFAAAPIPAELGGTPVPSLAPMLAKVTPGVVNIAVKGKVREENPLLQDPFFRRFFNLPQRQQPEERETQSTGSGVIVDAANGYVLTNGHVVENATRIEVTTKENRRFTAKLVGRDAETDVAVLQIPTENLTAVPVGDSDRLQVGDFVLAVGNPFGLGQTVTSGIVSALGRAGLGIESYEDFIQTDASINPGNSGGALITLDGRLIGINTALFSHTGSNVGIGFAVPVNMAKNVVEQIVTHREVKRGRIGVLVQDVTPELAQTLGVEGRGAVVSALEPGSPAARAGLTQGDVVTAIDTTPIRDASHLRNLVGLKHVGTTIEITSWRKGVPATTVSVRIEPWPATTVTGRRGSVWPG